MIVCPYHGLRYDPLVHTGCRLCRRRAIASDRRRQRLVIAGMVTLFLLVIVLIVVLWPQARPTASPVAPAESSDAAEVSAALASLPEEACVVPFLNVNPEIEVPEMRHRCDGKDARACTRLGFVCDQTTWSRYPPGVLPSNPFDSRTCAALRTSVNIRESCTVAGRTRSWFSAGCNAGDWLGCIQPSDPLDKNRLSDDERRQMAESACDRNEVAACAELGLSALTKSSALRAAYERLTKEILACRADGGKKCGPSSEARAAIGPAKVIAEREALEAALRAGRVEASVIDGLKRACDAKDGAACFDLGRASKDASRASAAMLRACQLASVDGCLSLQTLYLLGAEGLPEYSRALGALRRAAELSYRKACAGDGSACSAAAKRLADDGFPVRPAPLDPDAMQTACQEGNAERCMQLARSLAAGSRDTPPDPVAAGDYRGMAMSLWNASCTGGDGPSCLAFARLLRGGPDATRDSGGAAVYAKKGCNEGRDRTSCIVLARMYEHGEGVAKDSARAKRCLDAAMDFGRAAGCP